MLAPSEKHLEDWIVNNPHLFAERIGLSMRRIVARQPIFPSGRPDLIAAFRLCVGVIELKKGAVDGQAIAQLCRYMGDIRYRFTELVEKNSPDGKYREELHLRQSHHGVSPIRGIIIGKSFDNNAYLAGNALQANLFCYDYNGESYTFEYADNQTSDGLDLDGTDTDFAIKELVRHLGLLYEDHTILRSIYESETRHE